MDRQVIWDSVWGIFETLGFHAFCLSSSNQITWQNKLGKQLLKEILHAQETPSLNKLFAKDEQWVFSHSCFDALKGKPCTKTLKTNHKELSKMEFSFYPVDAGASEPWILILARDISSKFQSQEILSDISNHLVEIHYLSSLGRLALYSAQQEDQGKKFIAALSEFTQTDSLKMKRLNLGHICSDVCNLLEGEFSKKGIDFKYTNWENLPQIEGSAHQLKHMLLSLLMNSLEAFDHSSKVVSEKWIKLEVNETVDKIDIIISDSGPGIPRSIQSKVSQSFFTTKVSLEHSGMGLTSVEQVVANHQGKIFYDNSSVHTRMLIRLPKKQVQSEAA